MTGSVDDFNEAHPVIDHGLLAVRIFYRRVVSLNVREADERPSVVSKKPGARRRRVAGSHLDEAAQHVLRKMKRAHGPVRKRMFCPVWLDRERWEIAHLYG